MTDQPRMCHAIDIGIPGRSLEIAAVSDRGGMRSENQDRWSVIPFEVAGMCAILVADGMGGHVGGAEAATRAIAAAEEVLRAAADPADALAWAFAAADRSVAELREGAGVRGTTLVAAVVSATGMRICNVGDSRAYVLDRSGIVQVTQDHSALGEYVRSGSVSREDSARLPGRSLLTRAVTGDGAAADVFDARLADDGLLLLCTDGLWAALTEAQLRELFAAPQPVAQLVERACDAALAAGSRDNVTAVACRARAMAD